MEAVKVAGEPAVAQGATCGLVMPISSIDGCSAEHWAEVKAIICDAIESIKSPSFAVRLVSDADDVGVIQKRIVHGVYSSDIVICDVSGKNPNVMFELGMRLAFDKPTILIKDDKTDYSFDTSVIEHITYPRDLRFSRIVSFKNSLIDKVSATYRASKENPEHSTFLKNFGQFNVANLAETVAPADKLVLEMMSDLQSEFSRLRRSIDPAFSRRNKSSISLDMEDRIMNEIISYRIKKGVDKYSDLFGDSDMYRELEVSVEAPKHFGSPQEFNEAVDRVLKRIAG